MQIVGFHMQRLIYLRFSAAPRKSGGKGKKLEIDADDEVSDSVSSLSDR